MPPKYARITSTFFTNLIARLGIRPPFSDGFELLSTVQPVSLVDSDITLTAVSSTITLDSVSTNGILAAPLAAVVMADSGPVTQAGTYAVLVMVGVDTTAAAQVSFNIQRRDAANAANIWSQLYSLSLNGSQFFQQAYTVKLAASERIRVITQANTTGNVQASVVLQQVS